MAGSIDYYVQNVKTYCNQMNYNMLADFVQQQIENLARNLNQLDNLLNSLKMQDHSIGVLGILSAKYSTQPTQDLDMLFNQTQEFLEQCSGDQIHYASSLFAELCHKYANILIQNGKAHIGILPLKRALQKAPLLPHQLTSIHADFCLVCLVSKNLTAAIPVLDLDVQHIMREGTAGFEAKYFLLYYYYGGMIYTALKKYERALYFFEVVVTTPSVAVSHIMLEAFKKYILVSLILHEKVLQLPKYTSQIVAKYIKPLCQPYNELATAFATNNAMEVRNVMDKHVDTYRQDRNYGLVKQCLTFMYKKSIQRLTKTFLTLSLADMASRVHLSGGAREAEKYVLHMIADGEIFATINQRDGMVSFHDNPEKHDSAGMLKRLDVEMRKCMQLDDKLREMDREITVNPLYIQKSSGLHDDDVSGSNKFPPYGAV